MNAPDRRDPVLHGNAQVILAAMLEAASTAYVRGCLDDQPAAQLAEVALEAASRLADMAVHVGGPDGPALMAASLRECGLERIATGGCGCEEAPPR